MNTARPVFRPSARAALSVFSVLAGIEVILDELNKHAEAVDKALIDALERAQAQAAGESDGEDETEEGDQTTSGAQEQSASPPETRPDAAARSRIERLFEEARRDTSKAVSLKEELDRLGVFRQYEDRFLDLFRRAG